MIGPLYKQSFRHLTFLPALAEASYTILTLVVLLDGVTMQDDVEHNESQNLVQTEMIILIQRFPATAVAVLCYHTTLVDVKII